MKTPSFRLSQLANVPSEAFRTLVQCGSPILILFVTSCLLTNPLSASERWVTLKAINWVENPFNKPKAGPNGELGPYQFRANTWRAYTQKPFTLALEQKHSDDVAIQHYEWIKRSLQNSGIEPTIFYIALAWNAGLDKVVKGRAPMSAYRYATQVNNLAAELGSRAKSAATDAALDPDPEPPADCGGALVTGTSPAWAGRHAAWLPLPRASD
jgi:hypothetical protein